MLFNFYVVIAVGVLFALVALQRHRAKVWNARAGASTGIRAKGNSFAPVWLQTTLPRPSMFAFRDRRKGSLSIDPEHRRATFHPRTGPPVEIATVSSVEMGKRGTDIMNTWLQVNGQIGSDASVAYLNDAGCFGWRAVLSRSNTKLADALASLIERA